MKYIDWLDRWLENYIRPSVKVRTYERYRLIIEQHIKDNIGGMELDELSPLVLQSFITELLQSGNRKTGKGLSPNSVNERQCRDLRHPKFFENGAPVGADERIHG